MNVASTIIKILNAWSVALYFRPRYHYTSLTQKRRLKNGIIVISNHTSAMDFLLLLLIFRKDDLHCLVSETIYDCNVILKHLLKWLLAIRVDRLNHDLEFLQICKECLLRGENILIFPESRLPRDGEQIPLPFMPTYIHIALETGKPILPVWHSPTYTLKRTNVVIGDLIHLDLSQAGQTEYINEQNIRIRNELIALGNHMNEE